MAFSDDTYDKIQRYLDGEMEAEERAEFEQAMDMDEALAQEVALHADMQELLADTPENNLRHSLQVLGNQVTGRSKGGAGRLLWLLLPLLLLTAWWFLNEDKGRQKDGEEINIENRTSLPSEPQDEEVRLEEIEDNDETPQEKEELQKEHQQPPQPTKQPTKKSQPIAVNYGPNPALEFLMDNNLRSDEFQWASIQSQDDVVLSTPNASFDFLFAGRLRSEANLTEKDFKLHFFTNEPAAFDNFQPLRTYDLSLQEASENVYRIDFQESIALKPGLYYYLMEDYDTEQIYRVGKFAVKTEQ